MHILHHPPHGAAPRWLPAGRDYRNARLQHPPGYTNNSAGRRLCLVQLARG